MTSKEDLERLTNDIMEQSKTISNNPLLISMIINAEYFMPILENAIKDLERLETLGKENETLNKALDFAKVDYTTTRINLDNASARIKELEKENLELKEQHEKDLEVLKSEC